MEKNKKKSEIRFRNQRRPESDLRKYYTIFFQIGLILTLSLFIGLTKINITHSEQREIIFSGQEIVDMEEIVQTRQQPPVPPPPRPPVPVQVPNDVIIEDVDIIIDAELTFTSQAYIPPPPSTPTVMDEPEQEEDFFVVVEQMPELVGGLASVQQKIRYPELAVRANIQGRVYVQFIVNQEGVVENPVVTRGIGGGCDEEAIRVLKEAKFIPGMQRGRPVRVQYAIPITFKIH